MVSQPNWEYPFTHYHNLNMNSLSLTGLLMWSFALNVPPPPYPSPPYLITWVCRPCLLFFHKTKPVEKATHWNIYTAKTAILLLGASSKTICKVLDLQLYQHLLGKPKIKEHWSDSREKIMTIPKFIAEKLFSQCRIN